MKEEVFRIHKYKVGYRVNRQLLLSLEDVFKQYNENSTLEIKTECTNCIKCTFSNIDECFKYFEKKPYRIETMLIDVKLGNEYDSNRITMVFDSIQATTEIRFWFSNGDDYWLLKNKIELYLKNYKLNYRFLSTIPIMSILLTLIFIMICVYTGKRNIVFPTMVQRLIVAVWLGGSFLTSILPPFAKMKRNLFPYTEFRVGQNEFIEKKNEGIRNFLIGTVAGGIVLGVLVNYISDFLF